MTEPRIAGVDLEQPLEPRSSVEIGQNAKHEPVPKVKGYATEGESLEDLAARVIAVYQSTVAAVGA